VSEIKGKSTASQQQTNRIIETIIFLTNLIFLTSLYALSNLRVQALLIWLLFSFTYIIFGLKTKRNLFSLFLGKEFKKTTSFFKLVFDQLLPISIFSILFCGFAYDTISGENVFPRSVTLERQKALVEYDEKVLLYFTVFAIIYFIIQIIIIFRQKKSGK
jgi:hypothetical protein